MIVHIDVEDDSHHGTAFFHVGKGDGIAGDTLDLADRYINHPGLEIRKGFIFIYAVTALPYLVYGQLHIQSLERNFLVQDLFLQQLKNADRID